LQLGIDIDFYANPGMNVAAISQEDTAYIKSLHANAVSISIPFFSNHAGTVAEAKGSTPTTSQLDELIVAAERAGLAVTLRPLLDEDSIGESRVRWEPGDLNAWFAQYRSLLLPYAMLAQQDHVAVFVVGVEFKQFGDARQWTSLDAAIRAVYHGKLAYSNNWITHEHSMPGNGGHGVTEMTDAYPPIHLPDTAALTDLAAAWASWAHPLPTGTVLSEVGIGSRSGAYARPYLSGPTSTALVPQVQANWFTAACRAVVTEHLGGIYFWSLDFGQDLASPATMSTPNSFVNMAGQSAIADCFSTLAGGGTPGD